MITKYGSAFSLSYSLSNLIVKRHESLNCMSQAVVPVPELSSSSSISSRCNHSRRSRSHKLAQATSKQAYNITFAHKSKTRARREQFCHTQSSRNTPSIKRGEIIYILALHSRYCQHVAEYSVMYVCILRCIRVACSSMLGRESMFCSMGYIRLILNAIRYL